MPSKYYEYQQKWKKEHKENVAKHRQKYAQDVKRTCIEHYGGKCACCGEEHIEFLTIDHRAGGGNAHRKECGVKAGFPFYRWIIKNDFPSGLRVLCFNCNWAIYRYGYCPHAK